LEDPDMQGCDLLEISYNGYMKKANTTLYKGDRERVTSTNAYLLSMLSVSIMIESAYETLYYADLSRWISIQNKYQYSIQGVLSRVAQMDQRL
jgi:hypothetical protein